MKRAKVSSIAAPVDTRSAITSERLYTVALGNGVVVRFSSSRHALAFQSDATRFLSDAMLQANLLLSEAYVAYRLAWPYLGRNVKDKEPACGDLVDQAERALDLASLESASPNATAMRWKHVAGSVGAMRAMALILERMYLAKTQGVQRHQMAVMVTRCNAMLQALKDYGTDVDLAHSHRPSPYRT